MNRQNGFTLVEISIVLVIIGLILGGIFINSSTLIGNSKTTGTIKLINDLSGAVADFKARYHYLPGDLPGAVEIPDIAAGSKCDMPTNTDKIGNGLIDTDDEVKCVAEELVLAGFIKGNKSGIVSPFAVASDVTVRAVGIAQANWAGTRVKNVIEIANIPMDAAQSIDAKLDDGVLGTGNVRIPTVSGVHPASTMLEVGL